MSRRRRPGSSTKTAPMPAPTTPVSHGTGKFQDEGIVTAMTLAERIAKAHK